MKKFFYLFETAYLGYRYHGWQKQTEDLKTIQQQIDRQLNYLLPENKFKTLPASRTDKMVSAKRHFFQLYTEKPVENELDKKLNYFLPDDIQILKMTEVDRDFQIIGHTSSKEYHYYFAATQEKYPYASPFMTFFKDPLNLEDMQKACSLFVGEHNFKSYCYKPHSDKQFMRVVDECEIIENNYLKANFFPPKSYVLRVKGKGFFRHQIRLMMGTLEKLGRGELTYSEIETSLKGDQGIIGYVAPPHGLQLYDCRLTREE